jgi:acyl carrier protein
MDERLRALIAEILDLPLARVRADIRRAETETWDSLSHLRIITAIEAEFDLAFTMEEIARFQTPADFQRCIDSRCRLRSNG